MKRAIDILKDIVYEPPGWRDAQAITHHHAVTNELAQARLTDEHGVRWVVEVKQGEL